MEQLHSIYSKTYNFVYLRAKTIIKREEDIQQLMKEVYKLAIEKNVQEEALYRFLGKQTYILGCKKYRKKTVREAEAIELKEEEYYSGNPVDKEKSQEVILEAFEQLPDMYLATLYAVYYDHMSIAEVSSAMGYSKGAIIHRLNYIHKFLAKALEIRQDDIKTKVNFSVEAVIEALASWTLANVLNVTVAQNVYASVCRELGVEATIICEEGELAGADKKIEVCDSEEITAVITELKEAKNKGTISQKQIAFIGGVVGVLIVLGLVIALATGGSDSEKEKEPSKENTNVENNLDVEADLDTETDDVETDVVEDESTSDESASDTENSDQVDDTTSSSEYILPDSDRVKLTRADLEGLSAEELRLARNEMFARYGTIFGVEDLKNYFSSKSWYNPRITFDEFNERVEMNAIEEANLALILKMEEEVAE